MFVTDEHRRVTYVWVTDDGTNEPDYDGAEDTIEAVASAHLPRFPPRTVRYEVLVFWRRRESIRAG